MRKRWLRVGARYVIVAFVIWITTAYIGSPDRPVGFVGALEAQGDKGFLGWGFRYLLRWRLQ